MGIFPHSIKKVVPMQKYQAKMENTDGRQRINIRPGDWVEIVQKHHQRTGELTEGEVQTLLTKSSHHPHGIKVRLTTGEVGRVKRVIPED
jgi:uncharacterized repeat protein (TIGR03833 family)